MKPPLRRASIAAIVLALGAPASAQIISTSLPKVTPGQEQKRFSAHFMITPLAKWDYKEVYTDGTFNPGSLEPFLFLSGAMSGTPNSSFMVAGEIAVALGGGDWSLTGGGWYNKLGTHDFDVSSYAAAALPASGFLLAAPMTGTVKLDMDLSEGHVGIFYKSFGIQAGYVRTSAMVADPLSVKTWGGIDLEDVTVAPVVRNLKATNDWSVHGVFRKAARRWGLSAGLGAYVMQGVKTSVQSPLRFASDQTVLSAFGTGSVTLVGPLGIDISYWYLGNTGTYSDYKQGLETLPSFCVLDFSDCRSVLTTDPPRLPSGINKSRFTIGIGFSF